MTCDSLATRPRPTKESGWKRKQVRHWRSRSPRFPSMRSLLGVGLVAALSVSAIEGFSFRPRPSPRASSSFVPVGDRNTFGEVKTRTKWLLSGGRPVSSSSITLEMTSIMAAVPALSSAGPWPVAMVAGLLGVTAQFGLTKLFQKSKDPVLNREPGYAAHNVVAFLLMVAVTVVGVSGWCFSRLPISANDRLLLPAQATRHLGAALFSLLVLWDIPSSLVVKRLRSRYDLLIHHIIMAVVAFVAATSFPSFYGYYYLGVVELPSIPLVVYDQLSVAYENCRSELSDEYSTAKAKSAQDPVQAYCNPRRCNRLAKLRDAFSIVAGIMFSLVRALDFTRVTLTKFLPDIVHILSTPAADGHRPALRFMATCSVFFVALQLFWFGQLVQHFVSGDLKEPPAV